MKTLILWFLLRCKVNIFRRLKNIIEIWYERHFGNYEPVREFDFQKAQDFYETNNGVLKEMALCMGFDESIWTQIIENGKTVITPICLNNVDGVVRTYYDVPCIYYCFDSGVEGKLYCFKEYGYNKKSKTYKYCNPLYGTIKVHRFGPFDERSFENKMKQYDRLG